MLDLTESLIKEYLDESLTEAAALKLPELDVSRYVLDYDQKNGIDFEDLECPLLYYGRILHQRHYQIVYFRNLIVEDDKGVQYQLDTGFWNDPIYNHDVCVYTYLDNSSSSLESDMVDSAGRRELEDILKNIFGKEFNIVSYDRDPGHRNYAPWESIR